MREEGDDGGGDEIGRGDGEADGFGQAEGEDEDGDGGGEKHPNSEAQDEAFALGVDGEAGVGEARDGHGGKGAAEADQVARLAWRRRRSVAAAMK